MESKRVFQSLTLDPPISLTPILMHATTTKLCTTN